MKKGIPLLILLLVFIAVSFVIVQAVKLRINRDFTERLPEVTDPQITAVPTASDAAVEKSIFVPYWTISKKTILPEDSTLIYFGISPTLNGVDEEEQGYKNIPAFSRVSTNASRSLLALRMLNREDALAILKNAASQDMVIDQTLAVAKENSFSGVVLDLELTALPFDSLVKQITQFVEKFDTKAKAQDLRFSMTMYGDAFYRVRPFDIRALSRHVDSFYVMAYDFHKAGGNPGPNFPISGKETYGYDFASMLTQFRGAVSPEKLAVTYGMFGYDWLVDENEKAVSSGTPLSLKEIQSTILAQCKLLNCQTARDEASSEMKVQYTDSHGKRHVVWFEDDHSVARKEQLAKKMGVSRFSFWAYSYF